MELQQHVSADPNLLLSVFSQFFGCLWYLEAMFHSHEVARLNSCISLYFVILHHKFKMAEWRGDASSTSGTVVESSYYVENQMGKINCEKYVKWDFDNFNLLHVCLWLETHPSSPVGVYVKREFCSCFWWITSNRSDRHKAYRNNIYTVWF